mmetsp:Transcript_10418/g.15652  ORF Transcript_10418/g.15652 Transcript_10418/m.15652 type:complete len:560 (-) Transcript_10418:2243-3922(-)|eukprot:CAMPEP_0116007788 /NCGR_PEP_ID=MMETSP0321-20121206/2494_1 /TAXON_ID=163516 /ORGANISM="Leptocylindrus danicus var. danicus, Strain B650" /LENGTH=559 /DNA_ID=CAMNT_0003476523 /DNA_START=21 /DNA_END=1700 /DNA_ORIENTATION=-
MTITRSIRGNCLTTLRRKAAAPNHRRSLSTITPPWATVNPDAMGTDGFTPHVVQNMVGGKWQHTKSGNNIAILDPMNANNENPIFLVADTKMDDLGPFLESMKAVPKSGVHNPLKKNERYLMYGEISRLAGEELVKPEVADYFTRAIMKCVPKSYAQASGEVKVTAAFLQNFGGDQVRFLARDFGVPGDHEQQKSVGYRWPLGPVAIIAPFNFPLEIPVLQLMGSLFMGNKPVFKPTEKVSFVMEQFLHLLHHCGMPKEDVDFLNCEGLVAEKLIMSAPIQLTQFTGSSRVAEILAEKTRGKVKIEDAGFDWKILGPDVSNVDYVAWQCDQDAYASSGQKCSAQSILFMHKNWGETDLLDKIKANAAKRNIDDLTVGPVLTVTTQAMLSHAERLLSIPGSHLICGGKELDEHNIPSIYGAIQPTAIFVPLVEMLKDDHFDACVTEIFGPFQVITEFDDSSVDKVIEACERMSHHLTAAVVSNDIAFQHKILSNTVNGTTYTGMRARTTGAPQNHWFGPCGDARGCGIGTPEAIRLVWSLHREIVHDNLIPDGWVQPKAS